MNEEIIRICKRRLQETDMTDEIIDFEKIRISKIFLKIYRIISKVLRKVRSYFKK